MRAARGENFILLPEANLRKLKTNADAAEGGNAIARTCPRDLDTSNEVTKLFLSLSVPFPCRISTYLIRIQPAGRSRIPEFLDSKAAPNRIGRPIRTESSRGRGRLELTQLAYPLVYHRETAESWRCFPVTSNLRVT